MRTAKIAGTLGPASDDETVLGALLDAGLEVARLNFSHGEMPDHQRRVKSVRKLSARRKRFVTVLADLQGPRFRVGSLVDGSLDLVDGTRVTLLAGRKVAPAGVVPVSYAALARDVKKGHPILLDDGKIALRVDRVRGDSVRCVVERGGVVTDRKGINLPGSEMSVPTLTAKDRRDLRGAVELGADWLAISFVRRAEDVRTARRLLARAGSTIPIMSKIERPEAIDRLDEILAESDGLLVARGDLGVELAAERVPILQKQIIEAANAAGKPVVTATQMLESMRYSPRPTRAESSDVANAVLDGSGCLLLTAETAVGSYPVEAVATMDRIIREAEESGRVRIVPPPEGDLSTALATAGAGCRAANDISACCLVVFTRSGSTARQVARFRPSRPILAFTPEPAVARQLSIYRGVVPRILARRRTIEEMMRELDRALVADSPARRGDRVVVLSGFPLNVPGNTNLMRIHRVGSAK